MATPVSKDHLRALVDMGSNGIRFSISDLQPSTARLMPTVFQRRAGISLYDVQYGSGTKAPIPSKTIEDILREFLHFKRVCRDFGVLEANIRVLATEATREAINSVEFRGEIKKRTGWDVELLSKEQEGTVGAAGIASSCRSVNGLAMDLGGGSTQLTLVRTTDGDLDTGNGSVSLPFGAAALLRRIEEAEKTGGDAMAKLKEEVRVRLTQACRTIGINNERDDWAKTNRLENLYMSGGGFRGWGTILMDKHTVSPYPIPIINGLVLDERSQPKFSDAIAVEAHVADAAIFRISDRRASQVPAVALVVAALAEALPNISNVTFCQGGVREGALFSTLERSVRAQAPLDVATRPYAPEAAPQLLELLRGAVTESCPPEIGDVLVAAVRMMYVHGSHPKELRASAALRVTTSGVLAGTYGLTHSERVALALILCERWGGEVPATDKIFLAQLRALAGSPIAWWAMYVGRVCDFLCEVYPAGVILRDVVKITSSISPNSRLVLEISFAESERDIEVFYKNLKSIERAGEEGDWPGREDRRFVQLGIAVHDAAGKVTGRQKLKALKT